MVKREIMLREMLERCSVRYQRASFAAGVKPGLIPPIMSAADRAQLRAWFEDWHLAIQEQYRFAINAEDSILGKQWHFNDALEKYRLP